MASSAFRIDWSGRALDYSEDEIQTVVEAMRHADPLTQGSYLKALEADFGRYLGTEYNFAVANCTNALDLAALLCRLKPGDEVIAPAHTFCASVIPFARTGARVVWADIDPKTWVISAESIRKRLTTRTRAILVVHLYGLPADMDTIVTIANEQKCFVIEDCAQSIGATYKGRKAGSIGDFGCFSFHGQKNLTTLGEGGLLSIRSKDMARLVPGLRHNGLRPYEGDRTLYWQPAMSNVDLDLDGVWPYNFCLGEVQCALASKLLQRLDSMNAERKKRAERFRTAFIEFPELRFQEIPKDRTSAYHLLPAYFDGAAHGKTRDDFIRMMAFEQRVKVIVQYYPLYRYPLFQIMGQGAHDCPETDRFFDQMVSFPFHHWMSESDFEYLITATRETLQALRGKARINALS